MLFGVLMRPICVVRHFLQDINIVTTRKTVTTKGRGPCGGCTVKAVAQIGRQQERTDHLIAYVSAVIVDLIAAGKIRKGASIDDVILAALGEAFATVKAEWATVGKMVGIGAVAGSVRAVESAAGEAAAGKVAEVIGGAGGSPTLQREASAFAQQLAQEAIGAAVGKIFGRKPR